MSEVHLLNYSPEPPIEGEGRVANQISNAHGECYLFPHLALCKLWVGYRALVAHQAEWRETLPVCDGTLIGCQGTEKQMSQGPLIALAHLSSYFDERLSAAL